MLAARIVGYREIMIDIGTGDGCAVRRIAQQCPAWFAIGIDACRENLRGVSRTAPPNALFLIANALALPNELNELATHITINFPWGSLFAGLLQSDPGLLSGLVALARPDATLEIRLNQAALAKAGHTFEGGVMHVLEAIGASGFTVTRSEALDADALHACPTTWAKRLASGRKPTGWYLSAIR